MDKTPPTPMQNLLAGRAADGAPLANHAFNDLSRAPDTSEAQTVAVPAAAPRNEMADSRGQNGEYLYPHLRTLSGANGTDTVSDPDYMTDAPARPDAVNAPASPASQAMDTMKAQANEERAAQGIPPSDDPFAGLSGLAKGNP